MIKIYKNNKIKLNEIYNIYKIQLNEIIKIELKIDNDIENNISKDMLKLYSGTCKDKCENLYIEWSDILEIIELNVEGDLICPLKKDKELVKTKEKSNYLVRNLRTNLNINFIKKNRK